MTKIVLGEWNKGHYGRVNPHQEFFELIEEILCPISTGYRSIKLSGYGSHEAMGERTELEDVFYIRIWSTAATSIWDEHGSGNVVLQGSEAWGLSLHGGYNYFSYTGIGIPIGTATKGDTSSPVAELVGNVLHIFIPLSNPSYLQDEVRQELFRRILEEVAIHMAASPEEKEEMQRKLEEKRLQKDRQMYVESCMAGLRSHIANAESSVARARSNIPSLQRQLAQAHHDVQVNSAIVETLRKELETGETKRFEDQFDELLGLERIEKVSIEGGCLAIFTETLSCEDPRTSIVHEIGRFKILISISPSQEEELVRWFNLDRQIDAHSPRMQAPHIFSGGNACFGNAAEVFAEVVGNRDFATAVLLAIQFVESVNTDDHAGKHINRWPVASVPVPKEEAVAVAIG